MLIYWMRLLDARVKQLKYGRPMMHLLGREEHDAAVAELFQACSPEVSSDYNFGKLSVQQAIGREDLEAVSEGSILLLARWPASWWVRGWACRE